jgi:uncharacterized membrane protein YbaN (DUF454 family)
MPSSTDIHVLASPGMVRVEAAALFVDRSALLALIDRIFHLPAVESVSLQHDKTTAEIRYDHRELNPEHALTALAEALRNQNDGANGYFVGDFLGRIPGRIARVERHRSRVPLDSGQYQVRGLFERAAPAAPVLIAYMDDAASSPLREQLQGWSPRRMVYIAAGTACFAMTVVAVLTPFIPTMPFVLATGYFLARTSPPLLNVFKRSPLIGRMSRDLDAYGGLRPSTKLALIAITCSLWVVTLSVMGVSATTLISLVVVGAISIGTVLHIPTVPQDAPEPALDTAR